MDSRNSRKFLSDNGQMRESGCGEAKTVVGGATSLFARCHTCHILIFYCISVFCFRIDVIFNIIIKISVLFYPFSSSSSERHSYVTTGFYSLRLPWPVSPLLSYCKILFLNSVLGISIFSYLDICMCIFFCILFFTLPYINSWECLPHQ